MKLTMKLACAALAVAAIVPATAEAAIQINGYSFNPGGRSGDIQATGGYSLAGVGMGRLDLTGVDLVTNQAVDFLTYCIDIFHPLHPGTFTIAPLSTLVSDPLRMARLTALVTNADPLIAATGDANQKRDISAAVQLAVWELGFETTAGYSLDTGDFRATGGDNAAARVLANSYIGNVMGGTWTAVPGKQLALLYSRDNQSQIIEVAVPEPATWGMMILGFGLVGGALRSRVRRPVVAFASAA